MKKPSLAWDFPPLITAGLLLAFFAAFRQRFPARVPVHWGLRGADRFVSPERGLLEGLVLAGLIWLSLFALSHLAGPGPEDDKVNQALGAFMLPLRALIPTGLLLLMGCILASPILGGAAFGVGIGLFAISNLAALVAGFLRLPPGALDVDPQDPTQTSEATWRWGMFYVNPEDPRLWVSKRWGGDWTFNFAHPRAKVYTLAMLGLPLGAVLVLILGHFFAK
ncbi:MAG TPA: DUF5808 domain-containing protein [Holophaga sp.]|nr:DUF5808 domain-containing protein [Holophaga sp.]